MPLQVHQQAHREPSAVETHSFPTVPSIDKDADDDVPQPAPILSATVPSVAPTATVLAAVLLPLVATTVHVPAVAPSSESIPEIVQAPSVPPTLLSTRPHRDAARAGATPGYYRNLSGVNFTHIARDPHDDLYGCNMHYARAFSLHGIAMTDAAAP
jgi:hypothetical protein